MPLAISQAGAYIKEVPRASIPRYLAIFRRSKEDQVALLNKNKEDLRRDRGAPNAVVTSWEISFQQIRKSSPNSADLLSLMSYLNRQAIPSFLIQGDVDEISFQENVNRLLSFSLIRVEIRADFFEMHRLIQVAMQHWLRSEGSEQMWKERAIGRLAHEFPSLDVQKEHWPTCEVLMSHVEEVLFYTASSKESELSRAGMLDRTACYMMGRKGDYALAEQRANQALQILRQYFDDDSDEVLNTLNTLAEAERSLGQFKEAVDLQKSILTQQLKRRGPEDRGSLIAMHNLACYYRELGNHGKAEDLMKRVVEATGRLFGLEHPDHLNSESLLVKIYMDMGKWEEAEKLGTKVLETSARRYGFEHVVTLELSKSLSVAYLQTNQLEKAKEMITQAIPFFFKLYGSSGRESNDARLILARTYHWQGKSDEAKDICLSCLEVAQQLQGSHPYAILNCANLLGEIHRDQANFTDALRLLRDTVESSRVLWGDDHPSTLNYMFTLATCLGDRDHAIRLMTEVLEKRRKVLPADHPYTVLSAKWLAYWKGEEEESGKLEAEEEDSEDRETEEGVEEEDGMEEVSEQDESEQDENLDEVTEKEESEKVDAVRNQLAKFHISSPASREAESR